MRNYLRGTAIALLLSGAALACTGTASADDNYHNDRGNSTVAIRFSDVSMGYRDGYFDSRHQWHHWRNHRDSRRYRDQDGSNYHDMNHDRDDNNGRQPH